MDWIKKAPWKKIAIVFFLLFNTGMVLRANRIAAPVRESSFFKKVFGVWDSLPPVFNRTLDWYVSWYSHLNGTDLTAVMFSTVSPRDWKLWITAKYANGEEVVLPLARQSPRTFMQRTFSDNKEVKFHNNIYGDSFGRQKYAYYLCRQYPVHQGTVVQSIIFNIRWRDMFKREDALKWGRHLDPPEYDYFLQEVTCPVAESIYP
jgi:hypothetical protein